MLQKIILLAILLSSVVTGFAQMTPGQNVQAVLFQVSQREPQLVDYIDETRRWYLVTPRAEAISEQLLLKLQNAFFQDVESACKFYGQKYLVDWKLLLAKSARESFWGASYLSNRAYNYFGIRRTNKDWACESFFFCDVVMRNDPEPAAFAIFEDFESSLWMFIHTIYSDHFLARLPDAGARVASAIRAERDMSIRYWEFADYDLDFPTQLPGVPYANEEIMYTWSGHAINNLCVNCDMQTDFNWIAKVDRAERRVQQLTRR